MRASTSVSTAVLSLLFTSAIALSNVQPRQTDSALQPWVTVDASGTPKTVTPVLTTISGTATVISGAPYDLTGTVFTQTNYGDVTTSTGTAPEATATAADGAGSFPVCHSSDSSNPWCLPAQGARLNPGQTYYFTWDASFFTASNTTLVIQGNYFNSTTNSITTQAFTSSNMLASWGFWAYAVDSAVMQGSSGVNVTLQISYLPVGASTASHLSGPTVLIANPPGYTPTPSKAPTGPALYIGLPTVLGFVILCVAGLFLWNRSTRRIGLGNVMSRGRHGYGIGKSSRSRMGLGKKRKAAERIQLMERDLEADGGEVYHDEPHVGIPRRDSDALGSLAGTPTEDRRMDFHRPGTREGREKPAGDRNLFREELRRQDDEN